MAKMPYGNVDLDLKQPPGKDAKVCHHFIENTFDNTCSQIKLKHVVLGDDQSRLWYLFFA